MTFDNNDQNNKEKDVQEYNFIEEKVISRKKQKVRKTILTVILTIILGGLFGLSAGVVFCIAEEPLAKAFGKDKRIIYFTSEEDEENNNSKETEESDDNTGTDSETEDKSSETEEDETKKESPPVIINNKIEAEAGDLTSIYYDIIKMADKTSNSMVLVTSIKSDKDWFENEIEVPDDTVGLTLANNGFDLLVLVNYDRVKGANTIVVSFKGNNKAEARLQSFDSELNIAILAVSLSDLPKDLHESEVASLGESNYLPIGTPIVAIGSPNGYIDSMEIGMISTKSSGVPITDHQIDLHHSDINYREDGEGFIINLRGNVVGIITNHLEDSRSANVNTFIGISSVKPVIESLVNSESRALFGISAIDVTKNVLEEFELENGIAVTNVQANSPAFHSGLQIGDVIMSIDGEDVTSVKDFQRKLYGYKPEDTIRVEVHREYQASSEILEVEIMLVTRKF